MLWTVCKSSFVMHAMAAFAALAVSAVGTTAAFAQENVTSASPPLQWPTSASAHPTGSLPFQLSSTMGLRNTIEEEANATLCKMLLTDAHIPIPNGAAFTYSDCPSAYKAMINSRQGRFSWADGAR